MVPARAHRTNHRTKPLVLHTSATHRTQATQWLAPQARCCAKTSGNIECRSMLSYLLVRHPRKPVCAHSTRQAVGRAGGSGEKRSTTTDQTCCDTGPTRCARCAHIQSCCSQPNWHQSPAECPSHAVRKCAPAHSKTTRRIAFLCSAASTKRALAFAVDASLRASTTSWNKPS